MTMTEILLTIGVVTFIIYAMFNIIYLMDLRKTSLALRRLITKTEEDVHPALTELRRILEDIRKVTEDVTTFTQRLRVATGTIAAIEKGIQNLYGYYNEGLGGAARANIAGLKAGVKAGVVTLFENLKERKEGSS